MTMRRGKRPRKKQVHPPRPVDPATLPDYAYEIRCQERRWVERGGERFLVACGPVGRMQGLYRTRNAAKRRIMHMVHAPDWEHRNPHAAHDFYWAKRVELGTTP
jgi:hypothetical protein